MTQNKRRVGDRRRQAGMTLIELLVVIVILGIISGIAIQNLVGQDDTARVKTAKVEIKNMAAAVMRFKLDMGRYPTQDEGLGALMNIPADGEGKWTGPYLNEIKDPWDHEYIFKIPGEDGRKFEIISYGADGMEDGEGFDADIRE